MSSDDKCLYIAAIAILLILVTFSTLGAYNEHYVRRIFV